MYSLTSTFFSQKGKNLSILLLCQKEKSSYLERKEQKKRQISLGSQFCDLIKQQQQQQTMNKYVVILCLILSIEEVKCSFWNEIPQRCIYDRTTLFSCWNTTFTHPIPLFNDLSYTLQNHQVQIRDSFFSLSLNELFAHVGTQIEYLTLFNNTFSSNVYNQTNPIYFRVLQTLEIHDQKRLQWFQLNSSYFPQLIKLDLSYNQFTIANKFQFNQKNFPVLKFLNLSHNQLQTIENLSGNIFHRIEILDLSFNPLETILNQITQFSSLIYLDLSSTIIKQLFSITLFPRLETFFCRQCEQIPTNEYEKFLTNCSHNLIVDFSQTKINSWKLFNPFGQCFKDLTLNNLSLSSEDVLQSINLENIQLGMIKNLNSIQFNLYDRMKSIDFSQNKDLKRVQLRLMSDYTYLQRLRISNTDLKDFSIDFNNTVLNYLHIDMIDMSSNQLETLDFLQYVTFFGLDLSFNRLKIIDINHIHFRHGMYQLNLMNFLNFSSNNLEKMKINWDNESPHTIDLSNNNLQSIELHGQTTYTLLLNNNSRLSLSPSSFLLDLPLLQYLSLNSIDLNSLEGLIYLHNLSNLRSLFLNDNQLDKKHRIVNWNVFYPWHKNLTHVSLRNMSIEKLEPGIYLKDYYHLLTVDLFENSIECDCILQPFIIWMKTPPPPLPDFYEPIHKELSLECPVSLFDQQCDEGRTKSTLYIILFIAGISVISLLIIAKVLHCYVKRSRSKPYDRMFTDEDVIALNETSIPEKTDDEE